MFRKINQIIFNQFPEHIRNTENYSKFIEFVEDYYKFEKQYDISAERDIDTTQFLSYYSNELAKDFPELLQLSQDNQRLVLQKLSDLYKAKGSENSYKSIFNILFGVKAEIYYPSRDIFKPSAAKWNRVVSLRFSIITGTIPNIENIECKVITANRTYALEIVSINKITDVIYEALFDIRFKLVVPDGGTIISNFFTGQLEKTIVGYEIRTPGRGFSIGDIFDINNGLGSGTKIRIKRVSTGGAIKNIEIFKFGNGYINSFFYNLDSSNNLILNQTNNLSIVVTGTQPQTAEYPTNDNLNDISDSLLGSKYDYTTINPTVRTTDYFEDNTYVGEQVFESTNITANNSIESINNSVIFFKLGYVLEYPGFFSTNVGFPDDDSYLQDSFYYQQFSYLVKSTKQFDEYKTPMLKLLHPAGLKAFGEYRIETNLGIMINIRNNLNRIILSIEDDITTSDELIIFTTIKQLIDNISALDSSAKDMTKALADVVSTITDETDKTLIKQITDSISTLDDFSYFMIINREFTDESFVVDTLQKINIKPIDDIINSISDIATLLYIKNLTETVTISDIITNKNINKLVNENIVTTESISRNYNKVLNEVLTINDNLTKSSSKGFTESITANDIITNKNINKLVNENIVTTESISRNYNKVLADNYTASDSALKTPIKTLTESVTFNDNSTKSLIKNLIDIVSISDIITLTGRVILGENASATDQKNLLYSKIVNDNIIATDNKQYIYIKSINETISVADILNIIYTKGLTENITASNYGVVALEPYYYDPFGSQYWEAGYFENERIIT